MSDTRFTQGPWFRHGRVGVYRTAETDDSDALVALVYSSGGGSTDGNAHLIAAAPELYEALDKARWLLRAICGTDGNYPDEREVLRQCTAALAKARGE